jgi:hypothetical protein
VISRWEAFGPTGRDERDQNSPNQTLLNQDIIQFSHCFAVCRPEFWIVYTG